MNPIQVLKTYSPCHMLILIPFQLLLSLFLELVLLVSSAVLLPHLHHLTLSISITCSLYIDIFKSFKPVLSCYSLIPEPLRLSPTLHFGLFRTVCPQNIPCPQIPSFPTILSFSITYSSVSQASQHF